MTMPYSTTFGIIPLLYWPYMIFYVFLILKISWTSLATSLYISLNLTTMLVAIFRFMSYALYITAFDPLSRISPNKNLFYKVISCCLSTFVDIVFLIISVFLLFYYICLYLINYNYLTCLLCLVFIFLFLNFNKYII